MDEIIPLTIRPFFDSQSPRKNHDLHPKRVGHLAEMHGLIHQHILPRLPHPTADKETFFVIFVDHTQEEGLFF